MSTKTKDRVENICGVDADGKIVASAWLFDPEGRTRIMTDAAAIKFCSGPDTKEIKMLTTAEFRKLYRTKGWAT
jgi:hypothetical protein